MDFSFSEDENVFREMVKELASKHIAPRVKEIEEKGRIPKEIIDVLANQGLLGLTISPNYGGAGASITMATIAAEEIAYADISVATAVYFLLNAGWPMILERYGSEKAKEEILPNITKGKTFFGIAVTEPSGGSDVAGIKTNAVKQGNKWIINGEKVYISGVRESLELPNGGGMLLLARTGGNELGYKAFTSFAFLLKKIDGSLTNGITPTFFDDIGRRGISTGGFALKDVEIDDIYRVGDEGRGFYIVMEGFNVAGLNAIEQAVSTIYDLRRQITEIHEIDNRISSLLDSSGSLLEKYAETLGIPREALIESILNPTLNIGFIRGGNSINVVSDECVVGLDIRVPIGLSTNVIINILKKYDLHYQILGVAEPSMTDPSSPIVNIAAQAFSKVYNYEPKPLVTYASSDAHYLRKAGIPTILLGPGSETVHSINEYVYVDDVVNMTKVYAILMGSVDNLNLL